MAKTYTNLTAVATGDVLTATGYNLAQTTLNNHTIPPMCSIYNNADIGIVTATSTVVTFNTTNFDTETLTLGSGATAMHNNTTNTGQIVAQTTGVYLFVFNIIWNANATGTRYLDMYKNSSVIVASAFSPANGVGNTAMSLSQIVAMTAGDYMQFRVAQTSGVTLNVNAAGSAGIQAMASFLGRLS